MQVVRVANPAPFQHELVREFFTEAAEANKISQPAAAVADLAGLISTPQLGCWVALTEAGPQATIAVMLPQNAFMECPQVLLVYGRDREATKAVVDEALKFSREAGYTRGWGINRSGGSDEAFERLFGHVGFVRPIGTLLEYEF